MSDPYRTPARKLGAAIDAMGKIVSWKCSACNWTKSAEKPNAGPTRLTEEIFENHNCSEHTSKEKREDTLYHFSS
jgi:hypothetical protein